MRCAILFAIAAGMISAAATAHADTGTEGMLPGLAAVSDSALDQSRARGAPESGTVDSSTSVGTINVTNGNVATVQGAFTGASGLFTVIQNTGNNVILQNATVVNVNIY